MDNITSVPKPDTHVDTRDFRLISASIIASDGTQTEIGSMIAEIQVRQDLFLGFMSGELLITDGNDLIARLGIHGGEYMFLHMKVPEQDIELKKSFRVYKIGNRSPSDAQQKYTIFFMSDEIFTSSTLKISKAYPSTTVSSIVYDILTNILKVPSNRVFVDETTAATSLIIPFLRPVEALNWLATRAHNTDSSCYFFYENLEGFHFSSLQDIYRRGTVIKVPYTLENKRGERELDMDKFAIDNYEAKKDFDTLSTVASGGYAMRLDKIDPISRTSTRYEYNPDKLKKMYEHAPMSNSKELFSKSETHTMTYMASDDSVENWIKHIMATSLLNNSLTELTVPGNMGLLVGTLLNIRIPYTITPAEGDMWDKKKSGKYLVTAVNHKFDLVNHQFSSLVWLTRDSLPEALPAYDASLPDKISRLNSQ